MASATFDIVIIGAGAAGLFAAGLAGQRGAKVAVIDHATRLCEKIRISGGGRCNFTNRDADDPGRYVSANPRFAVSALRAYPPSEFIEQVRAARIPFHEKHRGQLFCDDSSEAIIRMLLQNCDRGQVQRLHPVKVQAIRTLSPSPNEVARFEIDTSGGPATLRTQHLIIATGGLPVPKIGASDFALQTAKRFDIPVITPKPALVPLTFDAQAWAPWSALSGLSLPVNIRTETRSNPQPMFDEDLLMTHRGLSGPAILQISSHWEPGEKLLINLDPQANIADLLISAKSQAKRTLLNILSERWPRKLAQQWLSSAEQSLAIPTSPGGFSLEQRRLAELPDKWIKQLGALANQWSLTPTGTEGWNKAEVMRGGVDTRALHPKSMECRAHAGLYFIGEAVDVTGWLGGYNFQWAWSSGYAAAMAATQSLPQN